MKKGSAVKSRMVSRVNAVGYTVACFGLAFGTALLVVAGATRWVPKGAAGVDHILLPIVAFPVLWIALSLWLYGARRRRQTWLLVSLLSLLHLGLIVGGFAGIL